MQPDIHDNWEIQNLALNNQTSLFLWFNSFYLSSRFQCHLSNIIRDERNYAYIPALLFTSFTASRRWRKEMEQRGKKLTRKLCNTSNAHNIFHSNHGREKAATWTHIPINVSSSDAYQGCAVSLKLGLTYLLYVFCIWTNVATAELKYLSILFFFYSQVKVGQKTIRQQKMAITILFNYYFYYYLWSSWFCLMVTSPRVFYVSSTQ